MRKPSAYNQIISILQKLHKSHPTYSMGRHLSMALSEYGDLWGVPDKEIVFALEKYEAELSLDLPHTEDVKDIIADGMNLFTSSLDDEEEEDEYN